MTDTYTAKATLWLMLAQKDEAEGLTESELEIFYLISQEPEIQKAMKGKKSTKSNLPPPRPQQHSHDDFKIIVVNPEYCGYQDKTYLIYEDAYGDYSIKRVNTHELQEVLYAQQEKPRAKKLNEAFFQ